MLAVLPPHDPMTVPRGKHLKRSRGSLSRSHKLGQCSRDGRNQSIIASTGSRSTTQQPSSSTCQPQSSPTSHRRRKRRRFSDNGSGVSENNLPVTSQVFPTLPSSASPAPHPPSSPSARTDEEDRVSVIAERLRLKMTNSLTTTARGGYPTGQVCTYEDWQDIKELFTKAAEQYNGEHNVPNTLQTTTPPRVLRVPPQMLIRCMETKAPETDAVEAMPLLRAVIHECHRFLLFYPDPSELIMQPPRPPSPEQKPSKRPRAASPPSQRQASQKGKEVSRSDDPATSPSEIEGSGSVIIHPHSLPMSYYTTRL